MIPEAKGIEDIKFLLLSVLRPRRTSIDVLVFTLSSQMNSMAYLIIQGWPCAGQDAYSTDVGIDLVKAYR